MRSTQMTRNLRKSLMFAAVLALVVLTARPGQAQAANNDMMFADV